MANKLGIGFIGSGFVAKFHLQAWGAGWFCLCDWFADWIRVDSNEGASSIRAHLIFGRSLVLTFGANAIVATGHALVAEVVDI